ncbi:MAG: hypothetical protein IPG87_08395 [Saprospiraceae bacterium]|nr:hypothetical protein [Candidatus Vicinibacter affinis]
MPTIFNNKIFDIISYSTGAPTVFGIQITSTGTANNANVYNNLIGNLKAPFASTSSATTPTLRGINLTSTTATTTLNVSYNTIYLDAQSTGANFGTCGLFATTSATATSATLNLNNNNIVNLSNPKGIGKTTAYQRSSITLTNYGTGSNRNNFYAGGSCINRLIFFDGTNADSVLADFKTRVSTREANSVSESPNFLSVVGSNVNFLHIDPAKPTLLESGGAAVAGITTDYDGNSRNASTPDIGADEFTGTVATACSGQPVAGTITANPNPLCSNGITTICVSGQSTGSGLTYQWKSSNAPGGPFADIPCAKDKCFTTDPLATGTYYYKLIVTCPASGMSDSTSVISVIVNTNPVANVSPVNPFICEGGSTTLTASGGVNYLWSTGATTPSINVNPPSATNYTVTVTDAVGCTASASSKVTVINKPVITSVSAIPPSICKGENSQLNVEVDTNYFFIPVNYNLIDSTGSNAIKLVTAGVAVTPLTSGSLDDGYWSPISLPFQFNFYGISYSSLTISTNGNIHFETATASGYNNTMPNTLTPNATIAGVFSDLNMGTNVSTDVWYLLRVGPQIDNLF